MTERYPIAWADVEPRMFVRATDDWNELSAGVEVASRTVDAIVRTADDWELLKNREDSPRAVL